MAYAYIKINNDALNSRRFRSAMDQLMSWRRNAFGVNHPLFLVRDSMLKMRDGDGSQDAHYALLTDRYGTETDAKSKALFLEVDSVCGLVSNGASTLSQITAAVDQLEALTQA